jgi:hypothetical protein
MNDTPQDAWFYSREGERIGPVTFAELRVKASEAALNPRLDMVWTHGMAEWKPAGEIEGLFERRAPLEPPESLAPAADPYSPPQQESPENFMAKEGGWPGARRRSFLIATLIFPFVWAFGLAAATPFLTSEFGPEIMKFAAIGANFIPFIVGLYFGLQRLVNLGMSRWWYLGNLVPILNFWVGYRCFACPAGYAYHKKLDGTGIFLAIVYWLMIAIALLAVAAVVALMFGAIGSPELQQQIRDAVRAASAPKP